MSHLCHLRLRSLAFFATTWVVILGSGPAIAPGAAQAQFVDVGASSGATFTGGGRGIAWFDADGDGDQDLFVVDQIVGSNGPEFLFHNQGDGTFIAEPRLHGNIFGAAAADYDNDGDLDVALTNGNSGGGGHRLLRNDQVLGFVNVGGAAGIGDGTSQGRAPAWADYDKDGDLDLYIASIAGGVSQLYRNEGDGTFTKVVSAAVQVANVRSATWADFDDDNDPDLFLGRGTGYTLLRNDSGTFVDVTPAVMQIAVECGSSVWGDFNNDGLLDLATTNVSGPTNMGVRIYRNLGGGAFSDVTGSSGDVINSEANEAAFGIVAGDIDNDGRLDLIRTSFMPRHYRNTNGTIFAESQAFPAVSTARFAEALADFDNDGDLDMFVTADSVSKTVKTPSTLYRNDQATGNHWVHVDLRGTISNRFGIGAHVTVVAGGVRQLREVTSGEGYCSSGSVTAEFGLGTSASLDSVIVRWPSGIVSYIAGVPMDFRYIIPELSGDLTAVGDAPTGGNLSLIGATPDPFRTRTQIDFALATASTVRLEVHDLQGRRVARLLSGTLSAGRHSVTWDGRSAGASVSPGVYFVSLDSGGQLLRKRIVKIQ